jgi:cytochrome b5
MLVGTLLRKPGDPKPKVPSANNSSGASAGGGSAFGVGLYAIVLLGGATAYFGYQYLQAHQSKQ